MRALRLALACILALWAGAATGAGYLLTDQGLRIDAPEGWYALVAGPGVRALSAEAAPGSTGPQALALSLTGPQSAEGAAPGLMIFDYPGRVENISAVLLQLLATVDASTFQFGLVEGPTPDRLAQAEAGYVRYRYALSPGAAEAEMEEKVWIVPRGERHLVVTTGLSPRLGDEGRRLIDEAVRSLRPAR